MRGNIKNIKILIILFLLFIYNYSNAQNKGQTSLYNYLDKWKEDENKFEFIQINLILDCGNQLLFTASKKRFHLL